MQTDWYWNQDAEGRDDLIRMEIESEYDAYLRAVHEAPIKDAWTQEVSDMYAELDMKDCD